MSDWHDLPGELQERRPAPERVFHEVSGHTTVEEVTQELVHAVSELKDWHEEAQSLSRSIEEAQLLVHALQLRLVEIRYAGREG